MNGPVRIAHFIATNFFGGPEKQVLTHALYARKQGYEPHIISFACSGTNRTANELLIRSQQAGLPTHGLSCKGAFNPAVIYELGKLLWQQNIELLVSHGYKGNVVGRLSSWGVRIPKIAVSRGWTAETRKVACYEALDRAFLRLADHVVAVSEGQRQKILKTGIAENRVSVIRNCIELATYPEPQQGSLREQLGIPEEALLAVTAGRLSPEKNQRGFIEAAALCKNAVPNLHFVAFGDGALKEELIALAQQHGLQGRFHFPGFRKDMHQLMHEIDIFVLPSLTEGLPNVVLEAYACRKPVVATAVGGTPEAVVHERTGFLVESGDIRSMSNYILALANDQELRKTMGMQGMRFAMEQFDFSAQMQRYKLLYQSLIAEEGHHVESA